MGIQFRNGEVDAGLSFALGVEEVHPKDLVRAYGVLADRGRLAEQTTLLKVTDSAGETVVGVETAAGARAGHGRGRGRDRHRHPGRQHRPAGRTRSGASSGSATATSAGRRRSRPVPTTTPVTSTPTATSPPPSREERSNGEYALAVGVWNGNSDNSLVSTPDQPLFSIEVSTFVWRGFLQDATEGWSINQFRQPEGLETARVDPWTGLRSQRGEKSVEEIYIAGHRAVRLRPRRRALRRGGDRHGRRRVRRTTTGCATTTAGSSAPSAGRASAADRRTPGPRTSTTGCSTRTAARGGRSSAATGARRRARASRRRSTRARRSIRWRRVDPAASVDPRHRERLVPAAVRVAVRVAHRGARPTRRRPPRSRPRPPTEEPTPPPTEEPTPPPTEPPTEPPADRSHPPRRSRSATCRVRQRVGAVGVVRRSPGEHSTPPSRRFPRNPTTSGVIWPDGCHMPIPGALLAPHARSGR